jgi:Thioredoxin
MLVVALISAMTACGPIPRPALAQPRATAQTGHIDSTLRRIFDGGQTFDEFVTAAKQRREGWLRLQREATISPSTIARARAVGGTWQLLVVAADWCGDSMNSVPYAARLVDSVPGMSMRIVFPDAGRAAQQSHRSADGRTATPTFVLLDSTGTDVGCLVELPAPLRQWTQKARGKVSDDSLHTYRSTFYAKDKGTSLSTELVELLESARAGTPRCDRQPPTP